MTKTRFFWFLFLGLLPASFLRAEVSGASAAQSAGAAEDSAAALIQKTEKLEKNGNAIEAQKAFEAYLKRSGRPEGPKTRKIQNAYEKLNFRLLNSKALMPGSKMVEVAAGDSLYVIARKYKTTVDLIKKSNGLKKDTIYPGMKLKVVSGTFSIKVDKSQNILRLFLDDKPMKTYRVSTGTQNGTPAGDFKIVHKLENPTWYKAGAVIPSGSPKNFLGTRWLGFDYPGYGIHGTVNPETIGQQVTSGCVRLRNEDVEELYPIVPEGTQVTITD